MYENTVKAALSETKSKFALAEALATDIPAKAEGDKLHVRDELIKARQAVIDAGGEPKSVETLDQYRKTALWVSAVNSRFSWVGGYSFTAHNEARMAGIAFEDYQANPKNTREVRQESNPPKASKDGDPRKVVQGWTPEQKAEAIQEAYADPETRKAVKKLPTRPEPKDVDGNEITEADKKAAEAWGQEQGQKVIQQLTPLAIQGVLAYLEKATESLRDIVQDGGLTPELVRQVESAHAGFIDELNVAKMSVSSKER